MQEHQQERPQQRQNPSQDFKDFTDEQIAGLCQGRGQRQSQPELFGVLYQRHFNPLARFIFRNFRIRFTEAEDLAQDALIKAHQNLSRFRTEYKFKTWLYRIGINTAKSFLRKPQCLCLEENLEIESAVSEAGVMPHAAADANIEVQKIRSAISQISEADKSLLLLHFQAGMSLREISAKLKMPASVVRVRMSRAVKRLSSKFIAG